jgi:hypothetical protein
VLVEQGTGNVERIGTRRCGMDKRRIQETLSRGSSRMINRVRQYLAL